MAIEKFEEIISYFFIFMILPSSETFVKSLHGEIKFVSSRAFLKMVTFY